MVTVSDDFNRADNSSLGANWTNTAGSTIGVKSNRCYFGDDYGAGELHRVRYTGTALSSVDHYVQTEVVTLPASGYGDVRVYARFASAAQGYELRVNNSNEWWLTRIVSGGDVDLVGPTSATAVGTWRLEVSGTSPVSLRVYRNGVQQGSTYDDSSGGRYTTGTTCGIGGYTAGGSPSDVTQDNWSSGDLAAAATSYPPAWSRRRFGVLLGR